jgi:hypothetical protein
MFQRQHSPERLRPILDVAHVRMEDRALKGGMPLRKRNEDRSKREKSPRTSHGASGKSLDFLV